MLSVLAVAACDGSSKSGVDARDADLVKGGSDARGLDAASDGLAPARDAELPDEPSPGVDGARPEDGGTATDAPDSAPPADPAADAASATDGAPAADAATATDGAPGDDAGGECTDALPVACGDRLEHSTVAQGYANRWYGYMTTARLMSGRESVYLFTPSASCQVKPVLKEYKEDLSLFVLRGCGPEYETELSMARTFDVQAGERYYLVVDGYAGAEGSYVLQLDCTCAP